METEQGSPLPAKFQSREGSVFPLYHVLADVGEFAGGKVVASRSSAPLKVDGLILRQGHRTRILLANFSAEPQTVRVTDPDLSQSVQVKYLDETNAESAMVSPESFRAEAGQVVQLKEGELELRLRPYALARLDAEMDP
jgi:hypothetical protein